MNKRTAWFLLIGLFFPLTTAQAHIGGLSFFKVNGVYTVTYPTPSIDTPQLRIPQDLAAGTYLAGQSIQFDVDTAILQWPPEVVKQLHIAWDFGDGTTATGLSNTHTYSKPGPYLLTLNETSPDTPTPVLIESALLNILPTPTYQLPEVLLKVNGKLVTDSTVSVPFEPGKTISFDASRSIVPSKGPVTYSWNFGDGTTIAYGPQVAHQYSPEHPLLIAIVRVTDANGFFSDSYVRLEQATSPVATPPLSASQQLPHTSITLVIASGVVLAGVVGVGIYMMRRRKK